MKLLLLFIFLLTCSAYVYSSSQTDAVRYKITENKQTNVESSVIWDLSQALPCEQDAFYCPSPNAFAELKAYQYDVVYSSDDPPSWDVLRLFHKFEVSDKPFVLHNSSLFFAQANQQSYLRLEVDGKQVSSCSINHLSRNKCSEILPFEAVKKQIYNGKPIKVSTNTGVTFYLDTSGLKKKIEFSHTAALEEFVAAKAAYDRQRGKAIWKLTLSYTAIVIILIFLIRVAYRLTQKLTASLKATYNKKRRSKKTSKSYKLGIAQEIEALKRLKQQGEISEEDYERAKQKLIAKM